jgi:WD40 repeat protein
MALPWMVEALELETSHPREPDERLHLAIFAGRSVRLRHCREIECVALSPDGSRLATGSDDSVVHILTWPAASEHRPGDGR